MGIGAGVGVGAGIDVGVEDDVSDSTALVTAEEIFGTTSAIAGSGGAIG